MVVLYQTFLGDTHGLQPSCVTGLTTDGFVLKPWFCYFSADDGVQSLTSQSEFPASSTTSPAPRIVTPDATSADLPTDLGDTSEDDTRGQYDCFAFPVPDFLSP